MASNKVLTQNDINSIIQSHIDNMVSIVDVIVKASTKLKVNSIVLKIVTLFNVLLNTLFKKDGVVSNVFTIINNLGTIKINSKRIKLKRIIKMFNSLYEICNYITNNIVALNNMNNNVKSVDFNAVKEVFNKLNSVLDEIDKLHFVSIFNLLKLKMIFIRLSLKSILEQIYKFTDINIDNTTINIIKNNVKNINNALTAIKQIIETFNEIDVKLFVKLKFKIIYRTLKQIRNLCFKLMTFAVFTPILVIANFVLLRLKNTISILALTFDELNNIKVNLLFPIKIKIANKVLFLLIKTIRILNLVAKAISANGAILDSTKLYLLCAMLNNVFEHIAELKNGVITVIKLKLLQINLFSFIKILRTLNIVSNYMYKNNLLLDVIVMQILFKNLNKVFDEIVSTQSGISAKIHLNGVLTSIRLIKLVLINLNRVRITAMQLLKIFALKILFKNICNLFIYITLSMPFVLLGLIALPIIIGAMALLALGINLISKLLVKISVNAIIGLALLMIATIFITAISGLFVLIGLTAVQIIKNSLYILGGLGIILLGSLLIVGIGTIASLALPILIPAVLGLSILILVVGQTLLLGIALKGIEKLNLDKKKITENVTSSLEIAKHIFTELFNRKDRRKFRFFRNTRQSLKSVIYLGMVILGVTIINLIAVQLRLLQELTLDKKLIETNIDIVLQTAKDLVAKLFNKKDTVEDNPSKKNWFIELFKKSPGKIGNIIGIIMSVAFLAITVAAVCLVNLIAVQLRLLQNLNLNGDQILSNVSTVILTAQTIIDLIFNRKDTNNTSAVDEKKSGLLKKLLMGFGDTVQFIASIGWLSTAMISVGLVSTLANQIKTINDLPDTTNIGVKVDEIINTAESIITKLNKSNISNLNIDSNKISVLTAINSLLLEISNIKPVKAEQLNNTLDSYVRFVDKVNTVEVSKLEKSAQMFQQMANFSNSIKGNFEKLAESLSEDLMPILEELKEIMEKVPEKLDTGFQNTSASIAATTVAPTTSNVTAQVKRENPNMTAEEVSRIVDSRMKEHANTTANSTVAKIDELLSLLKGFSGEHVVVQTI